MLFSFLRVKLYCLPFPVANLPATVERLCYLQQVEKTHKQCLKEYTTHLFLFALLVFL